MAERRERNGSGETDGGPRPREKRKLLLGTPAVVWVAAVLYPLVFTGLNASWYYRADESAVHSGFLQNDQHLYTAYAREVFERGNGLFYANPHDADPRAPRVFSNLGYLALAYVEAVAGLSWPGVWECLRVAGGCAMTVLLFLLFRLVTRDESRALFFWALAMVGGGAAWLLAAPAMFERGSLNAVMWVEDGMFKRPGYGWWLPNVFRQALYPLETLYHALLYGALCAYLTRRAALLFILLFLLWWAHPLTALLAATVLGGAAGLEWIVGSRSAKGAAAETARKPESPGGPRRDRFYPVALAGVAVISAVFVGYNRFFIASFPSGKSLIEQTLGFDHRFVWGNLVPMWGFFLAAPAAAFGFRASRRFLFGTCRGRFVLVWFASVFFWTHNDWFLPRAVQPMHFTRGHFLLALVLLLCAAARAVPAGGFRARFRRDVLSGLVALVLLVGFLDNLYFLVRVAKETPYPGLLTLGPQADDVLDRLDGEPEPGTVLCVDNNLNTLIPSRTGHLTVLGNDAMTPFFAEKQKRVAALFQAGDPEVLELYEVDYLLVPAGWAGSVGANAALKDFRPIHSNSAYTLFRKTE